MRRDAAVNRELCRDIARIVHSHLVDPECDAASREQTAAFVRKVADIAKQGDGTFSYEWFFGACGLDPWGDLEPVPQSTTPTSARWDPESKQFRRL